jgi:hypothetical protein
VLTQIVYPWGYAYVVGAHPLLAVVLTARNAALIALLAVAIADLVRLRPPGPPAESPPVPRTLIKESE